MTIDVTVGGANSVSYGTASEADVYFTSKGISDWNGSDAQKEAHLINAAIYIENSYRGRWKGTRAYQSQALAFPRSGVTDCDGYIVDGLTIPNNIKKAQFEAAYLFHSGTVLGGTIERNTKMEKIGQLQVEYSDGAASIDQYPQISGYLKDYIIGSGSVGGGVQTMRVVRA